MAKQMLSTRIEVDLRDLLVGEAGLEGRSVSNMVERILHERYYSAVLAEREPTPMRPRDSRAESNGERVAGRSSAGNPEGPVTRSASTKQFRPDFKGG